MITTNQLIRKCVFPYQLPSLPAMSGDGSKATKEHGAVRRTEMGARDKVARAHLIYA
jgi:hypothetical protein